MEQGYIKLWRKSLDSGLLRNHKVWVFWTWCLLKATHKEHNAVIGCQQIKLNPGQFVFGRKKAAEETGLSEREVRTSIALLGKWKNLTIKTTNKFSIITLVNWAHYQSEPIETTSKTTSKRPASDHIQEWKNGRMNILYSDKETLSAYLFQLPDVKELPLNVREHILSFIDKVRQARKCKAITQGKVNTLINEFLIINSKFGTHILIASFDAKDRKEKKNGFSYSVRNPIGYIKTTAENLYSQEMQNKNEKKAQAERALLKSATDHNGLLAEINQLIK
jgi:hypothetical protein